MGKSSDLKFDHFVQFYQNSNQLLEPLSEFIINGLLVGDATIVICTPEHRHGLEERLMNYGLDLSALKNRGQYVSMDAEQTLSQFMVQGLPDSLLFTKTIGSVLNKIADNELQIRAFGEMVAVLWQKGNEIGALELEKLWNELGKKKDFALYCAYPDSYFSSTKASRSLSDIQDQHSPNFYF